MSLGGPGPGRVLVTGAGGMLGRAFLQRLPAQGTLAWGRDALGTSPPEALVGRVAAAAPTLVIHCAADTDVEGAEARPEAAWQANAVLPGLLAQACSRIGARLLHFSSTGCYGAWKDTPYTEDDALQPTTAHHRAKAAGEQAVREALPAHLILRLGWLYGGDRGQRKNFVWARIVEARGGREMASDPTQRGNPTCVDDVVTQALALLDAGAEGTFNAVAHGSATRYEYVQHIVAQAGLATTLVPRRFERRAAVSPNESALNTRLGALGLDRMPQWRDSLSRYVAQLLADEAASEAAHG